MKTVLKTTIKDNTNVFVEESVEQVHKLLLEKGPYIKVVKLEHSGRKSSVVITKSTIKMVKKEI